MTTSKEIYDLIQNKGDGLYGKVHIIDFNKNGFFSESTFRVYHADGICFNVSKYFPKQETDIRDIIDGYVYEIFSDFDGFAKIDNENILRILKRTFK